MKKIINITLAVLVLWTHLSAKDLLMVDTSGSVKSSKEEVKSIVHRYLKQHDNVLAFASKPYFVKSEDDLSFGGGTELSLALKKIQPLGIDFLVIVTDGIPNEPEEAIKIAKELKNSGVTICGIYVSDSLDVPQTFEMIADRTFAVTQFNQAITHCTNIREDLMGIEAIHKSVNADKYVF